jgi:S-formylglutathione hydrolase FrmB
MLRHLALVLIVLAIPTAAQGQFREHINLERLNRRLAGRVDDYTHNHGADRRLVSPVLGMPRDLYVYVPPGYSTARAYPLVVCLHSASVDEHAFLGREAVVDLDRRIAQGEIPPVVVACPDGTYSGQNRFRSQHSLFVNGLGGRFEDHLVGEVVPFVMRRYSIRPEREAHALLGVSAGGFGALHTALKHRDLFGAVATLAAPANMRYCNVDGDYFEDFDPVTFRWNTRYNPDQVIARWYLGLRRTRARKYLSPVFGEDDGASGRIIRENPADLLSSTDLRPGELAIYLNYGGRDNYNFDAQAESFAWLASQRGVCVELDLDPGGRHNLPYFVHNLSLAFCWLGRHILPPVDVAVPCRP